MLNGVRADALDQVGFVARVDVARALSRPERRRVIPCFVEVDAMEDDLGPRSFIACTLEGLAASGTQIVAVTPKTLDA